MKRIIIQLCALLLLACGSAAVVSGAQDPEQLVRGTADQMLKRLDTEPELREKRGELIGLIEKVVFPVVDFPRAARLILGRHWEGASETQRAQFIRELQKLLACIYSGVFAHYENQTIEYLPSRWSDDRKRVEIRSRIFGSGSAPIAVEYHLWKGDSAWKLYDLVVEGVSLVNNYRNTFREQLQTQDLDALIADLSARSTKDCKTDQAR